MLTLGSIVKHKFRLDLGEGRVTCIHDGGRVNVDFIGSTFSFISSNHLIDCTDEVMRAADEKQKELAFLLLESGDFSKARKAALESKFLVWSWSDFLDAERSFIFKFEKERMLRDARHSMEVAERKNWEAKRNKLQTALAINKFHYYRSIIRCVFSLIGFSDYREADIEVHGVKFFSAFVFGGDEDFIAVVSGSDWDNLFEVSGADFPSNIYSAQALCKCIPVRFLSSVFRLSKNCNEAFGGVFRDVVEEDLPVLNKRSYESEKSAAGLDVNERIDSQCIEKIFKPKSDSALKKYASDDYFSFLVAGYFYYQGSIKPHNIIAVGDFLDLRREPENTFDKHAVQIFSESGEKLGYVPKKYSKSVFQKLSEGKGCRASVSQLVDGFNSESIVVNVEFN